MVAFFLQPSWNLRPMDASTCTIRLLPKYRGAAPAAWTIINGEEKGGVTTMKLVGENGRGTDLSAGRKSRWRRMKRRVRCRRSSRLSARGCCWKQLRRLKDGSSNHKRRTKPSASFAPIIKKEDGLIDWNQPAIKDRTAGAGLRSLARRLQSHRRKITKNSPSEGRRSQHKGESRRNYESRRRRSLGRHQLRLPWIGRGPIGKPKKTFRCRVSKRGKD